MYKDILEKIESGNFQKSEKTLSKSEATEILKNFIINRASEYPELTTDQLEKNLKTAFKNGMSILALVHGAHYAGNVGNESNADSSPSEVVSQAKTRGPANVSQEVAPKPEETARADVGSYRDQKVGSFLNAISMNESSGGRNLNHRQMKGGIHDGDSAVGKYGLMPNTIKETVGRMGKENPLYRQYRNMDNSQIGESMANNPDHEKEVATHLANRLQDKFGGDESKMSYSWNQGSNIKNSAFNEKHGDYKNHDYVKKYHENRTNIETNPKLSEQFKDNSSN